VWILWLRAIKVAGAISECVDGEAARTADHEHVEEAIGRAAGSEAADHQLGPPGSGRVAFSSFISLHTRPLPPGDGQP
jgi:hypothetical protein